MLREAPCGFSAVAEFFLLHDTPYPNSYDVLFTEINVPGELPLFASLLGFRDTQEPFLPFVFDVAIGLTYIIPFVAILKV